jgi:hypothetical protein
MSSSPSEQQAFVNGMNLALGWLRGYVAARADGNRQHLTENLQATLSLIKDDLNDTSHDGGAQAEAFLIALTDVVQVLCERQAGPDGRAQLEALEQAIEVFGQRINDTTSGE